MSLACYATTAGNLKTTISGITFLSAAALHVPVWETRLSHGGVDRGGTPSFVGDILGKFRKYTLTIELKYP